MMAAMKVVEEGMSVYRASQEYGVPRSALYDRISGRMALALILDQNLTLVVMRKRNWASI